MMPMTQVIPYLLFAAMAATVLVLIAGVVSFAFGNRTDRHLATRLMTARVVLQGVAIALFTVMLLLQLV